MTKGFGIRLTVIALGLGPWCLAQQPPTGSVSGAVLSMSGEPLRKARVTVAPLEGKSNYSITDVRGVFTVAGLKPGEYSISAQRLGFLPGRYRNAKGRAFVTVAAGDDWKGLNVKLSPLGVLNGKITDEDGDPSPKISIAILAERYRRGNRRYVTEASSQTNDLGEYRVPYLRPGKYLIQAIDDAYRPPGAEQGRVVSFYPGTSDPTQAVAVELTAGAELRGLDIRMVPAKTYHVRGRVVQGAPGATSEPCFVGIFRNASNGILLGSNTGATGTTANAFDIAGVPAGSYTLMAYRRSSDNLGLAITGSQNLEVGGQDVNGLSVVLHDEIPFNGLVRMEGQGPLPSGVTVQLEPLFDLQTVRWPNFTVEADGSFAAANVGAARYLFRASLPPGVYLKSIKIGHGILRIQSWTLAVVLAARLRSCSVPRRPRLAVWCRMASGNRHQRPRCFLLPWGRGANRAICIVTSIAI